MDLVSQKTFGYYSKSDVFYHDLSLLKNSQGSQTLFLAKEVQTAESNKYIQLSSIDLTTDPTLQFSSWRNLFSGVSALENGQQIKNIRLDSNQGISTNVAFCSRLKNEEEETTELVFGGL